MGTDIQEGLVYRYLLSDLPEAEQLALEDAFLTDSEAFERVWEIENRLVDGYVRRRLTAREGEFFERNYLASPVHRARVELARRLVEAADSGAARGAARSGSEGSISWWSSFVASLRRDRWRWAILAVVLVLAAVSIALLGDRARLQKQINQLNEESASEQRRTEELQKEMAAQREKSDQLAAELERRREDSGGGGKPIETSPGQSRLGSIVSFLLSPALMRSGGEAQQLKLARETSAVVLQMRVQDTEERTYQVVLRTVEGAEVWRKAPIKARPQPTNGSLASVSIPASKLGAGDYILTVSASRGARQAEELNRYFFRVIRQ